MGEPSLTLICPTIGRTTIGRTIESVIPQLGPRDEFIIVLDGPAPPAVASLIIETAAVIPQVTARQLSRRVGDFGCTPCDVGIRLASGDAVFFIGDDDYLAPDAFENVRRAVAAEPGMPHVFAMMHTGRKLSGTTEVCQVSGQQIVVPRDMGKMPEMASCPEEALGYSDAVFIEKVRGAWGGVVFHDEVIATLPRQNSGRYE